MKRHCERSGPQATEGQPIQRSIGLPRRLRLLAMTSMLAFATTAVAQDARAGWGRLGAGADRFH